MKISQRIETIFSHAVALEQAGRFRNTIYALGTRIYVMNFDNTVILRFRLRKTEASFQNAVSFRANDYDSNQFYEEDGKIVFETKSGEFIRKKSCGTPEADPQEIEDLFKGYQDKGNCLITLPKDLVTLLDPSLSHVEISGEAGELKIVQRNIYSGALIEISKEDKKGLAVVQGDEIPEDFGPIGIRTGDFQALYSFCDVLEFQFSEGMDFARVRSLDKTMDMGGLIALCTYDELGTVKMIGEDNGREKPKDRRSQRSSNSKTTAGQRGRRTRSR